MNRQESVKTEGKKPDNTQEIKYNREKYFKISAYKVKTGKIEKNQDERQKKQSECKESSESIPFTHLPVEGNQDFSYRKAWGKDDKDENTFMRRRKKW